MNLYCITFVITFFIIFISPVYASIFIVHGTVTENSDKPLSGFIVKISDESNSEVTFIDTTDDAGKYYIKVIELIKELPNQIQLMQNRPNPFNFTTRIGYTLDNSYNVQLEIYNILGQKVKVLDNGIRDAGVHTILWNGCDDNGSPCSEGVYLYTLKVGESIKTKKMLLLDGGISYPLIRTSSGALSETNGNTKSDSLKSEKRYTIDVSYSWLTIHKTEHLELFHDTVFDIKVDLEPHKLFFFDPKLDFAVRKAISKPEGYILPPDVENLTTLKHIGKDLITLEGIEDLTSLTELNISRSQIKDLMPISELNSLTHLILIQNKISDIYPLSKLTSLKYLDIYGNFISDIYPFSKLTSLTSLNLQGNRIIDISPIENLTNLTALNIENNQISDISIVSNLKKLSWFILSQNRINDLSPISNLTSLKTLYTSTNQISDISPLANLISLTALVLDHNKLISDISVIANFTELEFLTLGVNQITDISPLANLTSLNNLRLSSNQISDISPLANLTSLNYLRLDSNQISDISALANLTSLTELYIGKNRIRDLSSLSNLISLEEIRLKDNQISDLTVFVNKNDMDSLRAIDIRNNPLSEQAISIQIPELRKRGVSVRY